MFASKYENESRQSIFHSYCSTSSPSAPSLTRRSSENALDSLGGIDQHHFLSTLLVAHNAGLVDLQQLAVLQTLPRLATLDLTGCPLQRVEHYRERVIYMLPTLTSLDGQVLVTCRGISSVYL